MIGEADMPTPAPQGPGWEERDLPTCPVCRGLVRRTLGDPTASKPNGPWTCDLHGVVQLVVWERFEVPTGYDEEDGDA
jgi:hypothetical protein